MPLNQLVLVRHSLECKSCKGRWDVLTSGRFLYQYKLGQGANHDARSAGIGMAFPVMLSLEGEMLGCIDLWFVFCLVTLDEHKIFLNLKSIPL